MKILTNLLAMMLLALPMMAFSAADDYILDEGETLDEIIEAFANEDGSNIEELMNAIATANPNIDHRAIRAAAVRAFAGNPPLQQAIAATPIVPEPIVSAPPSPPSPPSPPPPPAPPGSAGSGGGGGSSTIPGSPSGSAPI